MVAVLFCGCSKDDDGPVPNSKPLPSRLSENKITISDIAGIPDGVTFNKVKIQISGFEWDIIDVIESEFVDGEAVIILPKEYPAESLSKVSCDDASDYTGFWRAKADNLDAKVGGFESFDVYKDDVRVGRVYLTDWDRQGSPRSRSFIYYHYTNQPYSLSGYNYTMGGNRASFLYQLNFVKGWNAYARVNAEDSWATCTTSIPEELETVWRFE